MKKITKKQARYRMSLLGIAKCHNCRFMLSDGHCQRVYGIVHPQDVCRLWESLRV